MGQLTKEQRVAPDKGKRSLSISFFVFLLSASIVGLAGYLSSRNYPWPLLQTPALGVLFQTL